MGNKGKESKHPKAREYPPQKPARFEGKFNKGIRPPLKKVKKTHW